ncbi:MAG: tetratricopeptide repeat protein, partial [Ignavibacteria bacterium]|nr:tetratricopeptide repeat protein [Ignavibacteria bacterium]
VFDEQGNTKVGINYLERAIELDQMNSEFYLIQADMYIKMRRFDKAKLCFQKIEEIDPLDPDLWKDYANLHIHTGEIEKAVQILKTGLIHQPENTSIMYRLVATLLLKCNESQAIYYLETALELDFDGHLDLIEYYPSIVSNQKVMDLILIYAPWKS